MGGCITRIKSVDGSPVHRRAQSRSGTLGDEGARRRPCVEAVNRKGHDGAVVPLVHLICPWHSRRLSQAQMTDDTREMRALGGASGRSRPPASIGIAVSTEKLAIAHRYPNKKQYTRAMRHVPACAVGERARLCDGESSSAYPIGEVEKESPWQQTKLRPLCRSLEGDPAQSTSMPCSSHAPQVGETWPGQFRAKAERPAWREKIEVPGAPGPSA